MPIDETKLLTFQKSNITTPVAKHHYLKSELENVLLDTKNLVEPHTAKKVIPFILWQNMWNEFGFFGSQKDGKRRREATKKYSRGRKVFVDLGYNISHEKSEPHPAIVLFNFVNLLVVIPTTSNDNSKITRMEQNIQKMDLVVPADGVIFPKETILQLHQIRMISKNRIITDLGCSITDYIPDDSWIDRINTELKCPGLIPHGTNLLKVLEMKICAHYSPDVFSQLLKLRKEIQELEEKYQTLSRQLEELGVPAEQIATSKVTPLDAS